MRAVLSATTLFCLLLQQTQIVVADTITDGAERLISLQNKYGDGGWDDPLDDGNRYRMDSPTDNIAQIGLGLAQAYERLTASDRDNCCVALQKAGDLLRMKSGNFSPCDGLFAKQLDRILNTTIYTAYVKTNFYDALEAKTYSGYEGYSTADYVNETLAAYDGTYEGWYLGLSLASAKAVGASSTTAWASGVRSALEQLSNGTTNQYRVSDLAGSVYGLASANVTTFEPLQGGPFSGASSLASLTGALASLRSTTTGAFKVDSNSGTGSESVETTAYAMLALSAADSRYQTDVYAAANYLRGVHLPKLSGVPRGWEDRAADGENNATTGTALWALGTPEPGAAVLLLVGGLCLTIMRSFRRLRAIT
jgi:hypothetical protein